ncbi:hypothetical protein D1007_30269 [Hordeum vulgare]|nr:hypothetical protein D1007_30269 [Hordeum vulgare]
MAAPAAADPVDSRATPSGERVSYGERWSSLEGESSARSYSNVARTPPACPPAAAGLRRTTTAPGRAAHTSRPAVQDRLGPRSEVHRASGGPVLDAEGFQQPRHRNHHRRPRRDAPAGPASPPHRRSPTPEEAADLCFRCLDPRHRVRNCPNDVRCRRCLVLGHASRSCGGGRATDASRRTTDATRRTTRSAENAPPPPRGTSTARLGMLAWPRQQGPNERRHRVNKAPLNRVTSLQKGASPGARAHPPPDQDRTVSSKDRQSSALVPASTCPGTAGAQPLAAKAHAPSAVPDPNSPTTAKADPLGTARPRALPAPDQNTTGTTAASAELALASQVPDSQPVSPAAWSGQSGVALTPAARVPHDAPDQTP